MTPPCVKFGDVVRLNTDRVANPLASGIERYVGLEHITPENLHIRNWGLVAEGTTFTNHFKPGQVLFGKRRAYQRKVALAEFEGICSGDIYVFESKNPEILLPGLLPFICQSEGFYQHAVTTSAGSLSPRTNWEQLAGYEFPLPPLDEQRRVADLLWAADEAIGKHEELFLATKKAKISLRQELLAYGISALRYDQAQSVNSNNWIDSSLGDLCIAIIDCPHTTPNFVKSGILVLRNFNIKDGQLLMDNPSYTTETEYQERNRRITPLPGDVVFSREAPFGEACVIPENTKISLGQRTMLFRPKETVLFSQFLVEYFYAPFGRQKLGSLSTGTTALHVNVEDMRSFTIKLPPIEEQREIVQILQSFNIGLSTTRENMLNLKKVKDQILKSFFS